MKVFQMTFPGVDDSGGPRDVAGGMPSPTEFTAKAGDLLTSAIVLVAGGAYAVGDIVTSKYAGVVGGQQTSGGSISLVQQGGGNMTAVKVLATFQRP